MLSFSSGERVAFELKKRVAGMPGQVACINALLGRPTFW